MTSKNKIQLNTALCINISVIVMEIFGYIWTLSNIGIRTFVYYTTDSNLFSLITNCIFSIFLAKALIENNPDIIPHWVRILKLMSVTCLALTFFSVTLFTSFTEETYADMLFKDDRIFFHVLCPILSIISYIFFELHSELKTVHSLIAIIPTLLYAAVILILNIRYIVYGPYPFLYIYEQSIFISCFWFIATVGGAFILSVPIRIFGKIFSKA